MPQPSVRCTEFVELVTDWMEGALDDPDRLQVEEHLAICPHCSEYVVQIRHSVDVLHRAPRTAPPAAARSALLEEFRRRAD